MRFKKHTSHCKGGEKMPDKIEFMAMGQSLPVNSKAMINRLREIMDENQTNCLQELKDDWATKTVLWMLMSQVFGQLAKIDLLELWSDLYKEYNSKEV